MKFIRRGDMGWPATAARLQPEPPKGVKVHYEGGGEVHEEHSRCVGHWTDIRNMHLADKEQGWSDVAYNLAVCSHGYVLEGRGAGHQSGANGSQTTNREHYAVCVLIGGSQQPSALAVSALKEAIQYLREHGAGSEIKGHRDGYATDCPGEPLYALVKSGKLEPGTEEDMALDNSDARTVWAYTGSDTRSDAYAYLRNTWDRAGRVDDKLNDLTTKVDALVTTGLTEAQLNEIVQRVLDGLKARLES
jgi:hypothetical protein